MALLEVHNLNKTYSIGGTEIRALQDVSLSIEEGEFVAIMGPSGSGKSTLMHVLGFLDSPDSGEIRFMGKSMTGLTEEAYAFFRNRVIGFIFQQFNLMSRSNALENVVLPLLYSEHPSRKIHKSARLLKRVGLGKRFRHKPNELSGGQQQRVAIARALINQPRIIFADEPTGNLDSHSGQEIMKILTALHRTGMTVVLVTHDESIGHAAERIIRMHDGRIAADERLSERKTHKPEASAVSVSLENLHRKKYNAKEFQEHFIQAFRMILGNKMRSLLSVLGVLIGVACVITMLALGKGAQQSIAQELSRLGSNLIGIRSGSAKVHGVQQGTGALTRFTMDDADSLRQTIPSVARVVAQVRGTAQVVYGDKNWNAMLLGATPEYAPMKNQVPVMGRFFTSTENQMRSRVAVIGQTVIRELFGDENPIGKTIKINRIYFQVIGILPSLGANAFHDQDDVIVIPLMTAMKRVLGKDYLDNIDVEIRSVGEIKTAETEIRNLIIRRHRLTPERYDTFEVRNFTSIQEALSNTTKTFSILLGCVAAISLVVGGIGIMNIMLVSVKERTREIGLRKAVGATPFDILLQFLVESVTITFIGGLAGISLAMLVSWLVATVAQWKMVISVSSFLLAFFFSAVVGLIFGLWPAKQAARLDPITALRYE